ncbi:outer membrane protein assembly factor BamD [Allofrancisella guangzhouensis]|uniref:Outer membrane protein assembly factor BamD n=1 Tax=Allofrancisella guangzhouensis TaxID=594679 RepID=A0A0A8E5J5_9GAMM|nr:outer membrane protein assembly factor BamD [Allofrancisella guangzhouensis]AJC48872.1 competence protein ComL [Allofrancisella guangzhouensis]MBK2026934.1 outer membrane protein assembly factor BamD [Allofrancisella guangzhouensis]MBK2043636.1 outer membrane protein assembly factor BamD [Allofrancisella guangzhouensis]MBK2045980.1 outer membrane protein assembly factor BamD [Allofrancisella guangzhouensis]
MTRFLYLIATLSMVFALVGCGPKKDNELPQVYTGYTAEFIYANAHKQMQNNDYFDAIRSYKSLVAQYPFTPLAEKGMVDLVYVYYMDDESTMSLALAQQFIKMYPYSKYKGYIYYMIGIVGFENGRGLLQTYGPYDMGHHDPTGYVDAYNNFEKALALDPEGSFVPDAKRRMVYINNTIAKYYNNIAHFYYKRGAFNAAIDRASQVIRNYPQSSSTEDALIITIKAYRDLGLNVQAKANLEVLKKNYPNSNYLKNLRPDGSEEPSWFERWFGWL